VAGWNDDEANATYGSGDTLLHINDVIPPVRTRARNIQGVTIIMLYCPCRTSTRTT
jgi:hypothetical protein